MKGPVRRSARALLPAFTVIIRPSKEDKAFIAEVPELPGCMADGPTYQKALSNVQLAIKEWIETALAEGRKIPRPQKRLAAAV